MLGPDDRRRVVPLAALAHERRAAVRAIWKGAVSFGLVNVPIRLYTATQEHDIRFHQVHAEDGGRIRMKRVCSVDGEEVPYSEIAKGYESPDGRLVVLTDEDLSELPVSSSREIDVLEFVPESQVDPIMMGKTYYLEPESRALKPYVLLRDALESTERMAVVKVALRQRESLAVLRVREGVIVLQSLLWPDEVRAPEFDILNEDVELRPAEQKMAASLVESLAGDFAPEEFEDAYAKAVSDLVEAKLEGAEPAPAAETPESGDAEVVDLLTALQRSVDRARASRGESAPADPEPDAKPDAERNSEDEPDTDPAPQPAKKTTAKKTTRKKSA